MKTVIFWLLTGGFAYIAGRSGNYATIILSVLCAIMSFVIGLREFNKLRI